MENTVITNHHYHRLLSPYELTEKELAEFDYLDMEEQGLSFFRYRGQVYWLGDFMRIDHIKEWHGMMSLGFFEAVLIALSDDGEAVKVATIQS